MKAKWLWLAVLGLTGCDPGGPNGKQEVLFFYGALGTVAEGLEGEVRVPGKTTLGGGKDITRPEDFEFDFEGTTMEVQPAPGVTVVGVRQVQDEHEGLSYRIAFRCDAGSETLRELRVRVKDSRGKERYADATDVSCAKAALLELFYLGAEGDPAEKEPGRYVVGARMSTRFRPLSAQGNSLDGRGPVELVDPQGLVRRLEEDPKSPGFIPFEALKPGTGGLKARLAGLEVAVPFEVVPDASVLLSVQAPYSASSGLWFAKAEARYAPTGERLGGLNVCTWEVRPTGGTATTEQRDCSKGLEASATHTGGTVCVTARGKTACTNYTR